MAPSVAAKRRSFTWQEVAQHASEQSCWVTYEGKVYDITQWLDKHPGGRVSGARACARV
jgi:4-hydroxysphinganine ceramide fatty acyl 2-hydroxylase